MLFNDAVQQDITFYYMEKSCSVNGKTVGR